MPAADIILKNANIITLDASHPRAEMVAIEDVTVMAVGTSEQAEALAGRRTRVIDCEGRTVVPGFNDAHCHLFSLLRSLLSIDLSPAAVRSITDIKEAVRQKAAATPPGTWLSGVGYNEFYIAEGRCPTRLELDEVSPNHPVVLSHRSLHACVLNSRALELAGIGMETPEPPGGRIERDLETGQPNGILFNMLGHIRSHVMPPFSDDEIDEGIGLVDDLLLSHGITSIQEATVSNDLKRWESVCDFVLNEDIHCRVAMMAGQSHWRQFRERGLVTGMGDDLMQLGAVKIMLGEAEKGIHPPQAELNEIAREIHEAGYQLAFHAVSEPMVAAVLSALEYVGGISKKPLRRPRIEHCGECPDVLLERIRQLGAVIVTQPPFIYYNGERYLATVAASQQPYLYRIKSPLQHGIIVAGSSDAPVVPINPLAGICAAVTRKAASGQDLLPAEAVTPEQALSLYTVNSAFASFEERAKGSLSRGKLADIAVLTADPTAVPPEEIKDIKVNMTIMGGVVVWER